MRFSVTCLETRKETKSYHNSLTEMITQTFGHKLRVLKSLLSLSIKVQRKKGILCSEEVSKLRIEECERCNYYDKQQTRCRKCGCYMKVKVKFTNTKCPIGKW